MPNGYHDERHRRRTDAEKVIGSHEQTNGIAWHAHAGNCRTLCGLNVTAPEIDIPYGQLITCDACRNLWNVSQLFAFNDFKRPEI